MINKRGETGHPCRVPLLTWISVESAAFIMILPICYSYYTFDSVLKLFYLPKVLVCLTAYVSVSSLPEDAWRYCLGLLSDKADWVGKGLVFLSRETYKEDDQFSVGDAVVVNLCAGPWVGQTILMASFTLYQSVILWLLSTQG